MCPAQSQWALSPSGWSWHHNSRQGSSEWPEPNSPLFLLVGILAGAQLQSQHGLCQLEILLACSRQGTLGKWMLHALEFQAHLEEAVAGIAEGAMASCLRGALPRPTRRQDLGSVP